MTFSIMVRFFLYGHVLFNYPQWWMVCILFIVELIVGWVVRPPNELYTPVRPELTMMVSDR